MWCFKLECVELVFGLKQFFFSKIVYKMMFQVLTFLSTIFINFKALFSNKETVSIMLWTFFCFDCITFFSENWSCKWRWKLWNMQISCNWIRSSFRWRLYSSKFLFWFLFFLAIFQKVLIAGIFRKIQLNLLIFVINMKKLLKFD